VADLAGLLGAAAAGEFPPPDGTVTVVEPPDPRSVGVFSFTAHHVVAAPVEPAWAHAILPPGDLSAPLNPPFLQALSARLDRAVNNLDAVFVAGPAPSDLELGPGDRLDHELARADVRRWAVDGGLLTLGRGVAGRWEVAVEVSRPGRGLGRRLFAAARGLVDEPVWAQVAPGNAASVRAEALLI
jgi:hypothetical protein